MGGNSQKGGGRFLVQCGMGTPRIPDRETRPGAGKPWRGPGGPFVFRSFGPRCRLADIPFPCTIRMSCPATEYAMDANVVVLGGKQANASICLYATTCCADTVSVRLHPLPPSLPIPSPIPIAGARWASPNGRATPRDVVLAAIAVVSPLYCRRGICVAAAGTAPDRLPSPTIWTIH
jgi:hypothetical protein